MPNHLISGQINPGGFRNSDPVVRPDFIIDDPLSAYRQSLKKVIRPNRFAETRVWDAIVLFSGVIEDEKTLLYKIFPRLSTGGGQPRFICMVPGLHDHLPSPDDYADPEKQLDAILRFPVFELADQTKLNISKFQGLNEGSVVQVEFLDPNYTIGKVVGLVAATKDSKIPEAFVGAAGTYNNGPSQVAPPGDYGEGILGIPGVQAKPGVKGPISEAVQTFLEICGQIAAERGLPQPVVTSAYRSVDNQISAMANNWVREGGLISGNQYLLNLYTDDTMASAIGSIFTSNYDSSSNRVSPAGRKEAAAYWTQKYGTNFRSHLKVPAEAVDLRLTESIADIITASGTRMSAYGVKVKPLAESDHFHVGITPGSLYAQGGESPPSEPPNTSNEQDIYPDDDPGFESSPT